MADIVERLNSDLYDYKYELSPGVLSNLQDAVSEIESLRAKLDEFRKLADLHYTEQKSHTRTRIDKLDYNQFVDIGQWTVGAQIHDILNAE